MQTLESIRDYWQEQISDTVVSGTLPSESSKRFEHLVNDSREYSERDVFLAMQGHRVHGLQFLQAVLEKGVCLILTDRPLTDQEQVLLENWHNKAEEKRGIVCWVIDKLQSQLAEFAHWFYQNPSQRIKVIGITGTNGKTSTAYYCAQLLQSQMKKVALIGTLGNGPIDNLETTLNTTPDAIRLVRLLWQFEQAGYEWVVMEVSSHAIALGRVQGVRFYTTAITQIGSDHLDFHGSHQHYAQTKLSLFSEFVSRFKVLNLGDSLVAEWLRLQPQMDSSECISYGLGDGQQNSGADLQAQKICLGIEGIKFTLLDYTQGADEAIQTATRIEAGLMGRFNIENLLCSLAIVKTAGISLSSLQTEISRLIPVPGRMQRVHHSPTVIIDFAHTADALQSLLRAVKDHLHNKDRSMARLWLVFGCGGDRDRQKRPLMAQVSEGIADKIVVTSDNPRSEPPQAIIQEIEAGFESADFVSLIDRQEAIEYALQHCETKDVVVIAGKGHEAYQEIAGVKIPFSDHQVVEAFYQTYRYQNSGD